MTGALPVGSICPLQASSAQPGCSLASPRSRFSCDSNSTSIPYLSSCNPACCPPTLAMRFLCFQTEHTCVCRPGGGSSATGTSSGRQQRQRGCSPHGCQRVCRSLQKLGKGEQHCAAASKCRRRLLNDRTSAFCVQEHRGLFLQLKAGLPPLRLR